MLKEIQIVLLILLCGWCHITAQYQQQDIKYDIKADYDAAAHTVKGTVVVTYTNEVAESLDRVYLHLWANAYSSKSSDYSKQQLKLGNTAYYFAKESHMGGYDGITANIEGQAAKLIYTDTREVAYIELMQPLAKGDAVTLELAYTLRMPYLYDRLGWDERSVQLVHWYPSIAVYDNEGWHTMPYLAMGEHYPTVADYRVRLSLPHEHVVSTGPIDGSAVTSGITDFAIVASDGAELSHSSHNDYDLSMLHYDNEHLADEGLAIAADVIDYMESQVGKYPHKSLAIAEQSGRSGMEYGALVTVSAASAEEARYLIAHEVIHQWFYGGVVTDQRQHAWMDEGFTTYYQRRYYEARGYEDHYSSMLPQLHGKANSTPIQQYLAEMQAKRQWAQPMCTHIHNVSTINYGFNNYEVAARWLSHLEQNVGQELMDDAVQQYVKQWSGKHPQPADLQQVFVEAIGELETEWFFEAMGCATATTDYAVRRLAEGKVQVTNTSKLLPPYLLQVHLQDGSIVNRWMPPTDSTVVDLADASRDYAGGDQESKTVSTADITRIKLGPDDGLLDHNRNNNIIGKKPIKIVPGIGLDDDDYTELYVLPLLNYNTTDGVTAGGILYNTSVAANNWKWLMAPQYGFRSGKLVGHAWTTYDHYLDHNRYRKLVYRLGVKSYGQQYIESISQPLQYLKIDPSVSLHFQHKADSHVYSKLTYRALAISNEQYDFGAERTTDAWSYIQQLRYERFDFDGLSPSDVNVTLEYQPYTNSFGTAEQYLKLTAAYKKSWLYSPTKKISFRLWGSYFLVNSQRNSTSYDRRIARGATALIHQGYNDYTYEETFFNRNNQNVGLWGRQVSYAGGGFKVPLGSQYSIGQSNDLALALNFEADIPGRLPKVLPLAVFLDVGYHRTYSPAAEQLEGTALYSGGLALNYGEGLFSIYIPLVHSSIIGDVYSTEGVGLLGRVSFRFDLNRFNPWEIAEDYNF